MNFTRTSILPHEHDLTKDDVCRSSSPCCSVSLRSVVTKWIPSSIQEEQQDVVVVDVTASNVPASASLVLDEHWIPLRARPSGAIRHRDLGGATEVYGRWYSIGAGR